MRRTKIATRPIVLLAAPLLVAGAVAAPAAGAAATAARTTVPVASLSLSGQLLGVSALSAGSAWAVGDAGTYPHFRALVVRWNGKTWKQVASPHPAGSVLRQVAATSARNAWAVGYYGSGSRTKTLILHWNGTGWKQVASPSPGVFAALSGVAATTAGDAWAVGYYGSTARFRTLILHWNGARWKQVAGPSPGIFTSLNGVAATSAGNAWAVGASGTNNSQPVPLIERWNGRAWRRVPSPSPGSALNSVVAVSPRSAWAVGLAGTGGGFLILRWDGKAWKRVPGPKPGGYLPYPSGVAATSASNAWVVGSTSTGKTLIEQRKGTGWARESSISGSLSAVDALSGSNAWAVGETGSSHPRTLILRWNGTSWQRVAVASAAAAAPRPGSASAQAPAHPAASSGARLWIKRYNGPGNGVDEAQSVAVSPSGKSVFVTGTSYGTGPAIGDYATVAYSAATGARLWIKRYNGVGNSGGIATKVVVSPSGKTVFVTGYSYGTAASGYANFATIAYNASTGAQLWVKLYNGTGNFVDEAYSMAVSRSGKTVFVTGQTYVKNSGSPDYATVAYSAGTGAQLWVRIYHGSGNEGFNAEAGASVAVNPSGTTVYVTGQGTTSDNPDYATVAYNAATGAQRWVKLYRYPGSSDCTAISVAVSPSGKTVFVTGDEGGASGSGYSTIAYNAATGAQRWVKGYRPFRGGGSDDASSIAVSPSGTTVYVTGGIYGGGGEGSEDYATLAYNAATGKQLWVKRYSGGYAYSLAVSPSGKRVYVTGASRSGYATVAYNAASGAQLWVKRYDGNGTVTLPGQAISVAVSRTAVFVTGYIVTAVGSIYDYATIGYKG